jgi:hypothetical protein
LIVGCKILLSTPYTFITLTTDSSSLSKTTSEEEDGSFYHVITRSALKIISTSCAYERVSSSCDEGFSVRRYTVHCGNAGAVFSDDRRTTTGGVAEGDWEPRTWRARGLREALSKWSVIFAHL